MSDKKPFLKVDYSQTQPSFLDRRRQQVCKHENIIFTHWNTEVNGERMIELIINCTDCGSKGFQAGIKLNWEVQ